MYIYCYLRVKYGTDYSTGKHSMLFNAGYASHLLLQKVNISLTGMHKFRRQVTQAAKFFYGGP